MVSFKYFSTALLATSALALPHGHTHAHAHKRTGTSKRGAAYNDASLVQSLSSGGLISWAYDWNMYTMGTLPSEVEFVPMLWGTKMFTGWFAAIQTLLGSGSNYILGFNEPDMSSQAAMSSSDAANYYRQYISPFSGQAKLVSPAVTNGVGSDVGLDWMRNFLNSCTDCGVTALAVHWYGDSADDFKNFVTQATELAAEYNLAETWVTEFALNSDLAGQGGTQASSDFLNDVLPWLDAQTGVSRYAYFMCGDGYLLSGSEPSLSGKAYIS
ncbi:glycoside hydrolase family 128 protein [Aspergillus lucknowensis]|uniref:Asl1-like glycosyl hydrolase catalytic domain-containing protein n=1 Tax=Aspergillus lucknowensis TaxID=176173 RepID=A0ABR4M2J0_9EURO